MQRSVRRGHHRHAVVDFVLQLLSVGGPEVAAGGGHRRTRRTARDRHHQHRGDGQRAASQHVDSTAKLPETVGLPHRHHFADVATVAHCHWPRRPYRTRRTEGVELAAEQVESGENVEAIERGVRPVLDDVSEQLSEHCERVPAHTRARLEFPPVLRSIHARRTIQSDFHAVDPVHTDRSHVHPHPGAAGQCGRAGTFTSHRLRCVQCDN